MTPTIALAIPHTPWVSERVDSLRRLCSALNMPTDLEVVEGGPVESAKLFTERAPNWNWAADLWSWGDLRGDVATYLLQLQDDVIVAPMFWRALRAMLTAVPDQVICLQGAHPLFPLLARDEHRWARSRAWMVGVGYVIPTNLLPGLLEWRNHLPQEVVEKTNEDDLIARWCVETARDVWHPIPTILDHDTSVASTYKNDAHLYRRATVTWHDYGERICDPAFWRTDRPVPLVRNPHHESCWFCQSEPSSVTVPETGARMGKQCLARIVVGLIGRLP